ncbi:4-alpha-glucanotransferase [Microcoleus sp. FACHB-68]|uniref:4-alpha-glucanotransferase n=1 Tax=Microcoleus sp. FACHB-68 TaxID=2692826 RepID=UPI001682EEC9|nr:4-alpha-glucanotransferase [Microcoleus sp. FACHB-68]MBD1936768.1 4-alpha-glucanotransferase [Microcoleus sp. FACHB-68]
MLFPRSSGILLHPTSFPSRFGIGDLGEEAHRFVDFLAEGRQTLWQVLPVGPTGYGNSPYMSYSALAGNPLLISPDRLRDDGLLTEEDFRDLPEFPEDRVDFEKVAQVKIPLLQKACENFKAHASEELQQEFRTFCESKVYWLNDYALFMAIKEAHAGDGWHTWDAGISQRHPEAIELWEKQLSDQVLFHKFTQFVFFRQWSAIKHYANERQIQIIGDIPIYVAHDSADVWAHPESFCLNQETGEPALMAGVPPDYFSVTGQLWGNPVYNWEYLQQNDFDWWVQRFKFMLDYVDIIRIDHFRGFESFWAVPEGETTAVNGEWVDAPGEAFFTVLNDKLGKLPVMAEDLGMITPEVKDLLDKFEFPGMKVLHFAFGGDADNPYLPFQYPHNSVVYTGTHDNDTTVGWFSQASEQEKESLSRYLGCTGNDGIHWDLIRLALSSVSTQAIIPLQDILGLGSDARMNFPSKAEGNWEWRYWHNALTDDLRDRLKSLTETYGRVPKKSD